MSDGDQSLLVNNNLASTYTAGVLSNVYYLDKSFFDDKFLVISKLKEILFVHLNLQSRQKSVYKIKNLKAIDSQFAIIKLPLD